jgi:hypothetical protein
MDEEGKVHFKKYEEVTLSNEDIHMINKQPMKMIQKQRTEKEKNEDRILNRSDILDL